MWNRVCVCCWLYLETYWHHSPTDLLSYHELFSQHSQDQVLPASRRQAFSQTNDPLPTHLISIILNIHNFRSGLSRITKQPEQIEDISQRAHLPHGFNAFFEEVEVTMTCQIARSDHVTIETPELLHLGWANLIISGKRVIMRSVQFCMGR